MAMGMARSTTPNAHGSAHSLARWLEETQPLSKARRKQFAYQLPTTRRHAPPDGTGADRQRPPNPLAWQGWHPSGQSERSR
jgi:hypothetical protein